MMQETVVFKDRVAFVTGAAGNIGRTTCRMLRQAGVKVAATDISKAAVDESFADTLADGGIRTYALDVTDPAAVIGLTETLAMENAKLGITVNSVSPGMILREAGPHDGTWVGWSGSSADVARAIVFLAADNAAYMTGVDMPVDGGRILGTHNCDM